MNRKRRLSAWILVALMLLEGMLPIVSTAQAATEEVIFSNSSTVSEIAIPESGELFEGYLELVFFPDSSVSFLGEAAKNQLGTLGQTLYDFLNAHIQSVASGTSSSTVFHLSAEQILAWGGTTVYEKEESQTSQDAAAAALSSFKQEFEVENVLYALLHDSPYALYWYDKVTGLTESGAFTISGSSCTIQSVDFKFSVVADMQAENYDPEDPAFDTTNAAAATAAAANAQALVDTFADYTDHSKLLAYKDEICSLVSYDTAAASGGDFSADADPWQLMHVFDGDNTTNVVCEGYAKAFQYLYDLSVFNGSVECITALGTMSQEGHMWNIVTINGLNYLTDITNSDSDTIGADGSLFLAGASGDINSGYVVKGLTFIYSADTLALWGSDANSKLNIAPESYYVCASDHTEVLDPAVEATCTEAGLSEGAHCSVCGEILAAQQTIPAAGHTQVLDPAVEATCTEAGLSEGAHCSVCGEILTAQQTVPAAGHTQVLDPAVETTCTAAGLSEGAHCSVCGEILVAQQTIPAPGHTQVLDPAVETTCTEAGLSEGAHCSVCGEILVAQQTIPAPGHTQVLDPAVEATCTEAGLSEGAHCSVCGEILVAQQTIPAAGHTYTATTVAPTCTKEGYTTYVCSVCQEQYTDHTKAALGHSWQNATCTAPKTCRNCAATEGSALSHSYTNGWDTSCEVCGHIRKPEITLTPMYRLYNPYTQEHLLTSNEDEKDQLVSIGWHFDGIAWKTPSRGIPVYRLYNPFDDWHTYSMSQEEIDMLVPLGWKVDGVICYSAVDHTDTPIYRLFNPYAKINYHILTASEEERDWLVTLGWVLEGVGWYGVR